MGENGIVLEHHADVPLAGVFIVDPLFVEIKVAALNGVKAGDHTEQGGFAAAGGTQQGKELAVPDVQVQSGDNGGAAIAFYGVFNGDLAHG